MDLLNSDQIILILIVSVFIYITLLILYSLFAHSKELISSSNENLAPNPPTKQTNPQPPQSIFSPLEYFRSQAQLAPVVEQLDALQRKCEETLEKSKQQRTSGDFSITSPLNQFPLENLLLIEELKSKLKATETIIETYHQIATYCFEILLDSRNQEELKNSTEQEKDQLIRKLRTECLSTRIEMELLRIKVLELHQTVTTVTQNAKIEEEKLNKMQEKLKLAYSTFNSAPSSPIISKQPLPFQKAGSGAKPDLKKWKDEDDSNENLASTSNSGEQKKTTLVPKMNKNNKNDNENEDWNETKPKQQQSKQKDLNKYKDSENEDVNFSAFVSLAKLKTPPPPVNESTKTTKVEEQEDDWGDLETSTQKSSHITDVQKPAQEKVSSLDKFKDKKQDEQIVTATLQIKPKENINTIDNEDDWDDSVDSADIKQTKLTLPKQFATGSKIIKTTTTTITTTSAVNNTASSNKKEDVFSDDEDDDNDTVVIKSSQTKQNPNGFSANFKDSKNSSVPQTKSEIAPSTSVAKSAEKPSESEALHYMVDYFEKKFQYHLKIDSGRLGTKFIFTEKESDSNTQSVLIRLDYNAEVKKYHLPFNLPLPKTVDRFDIQAYLEEQLVKKIGVQKRAAAKTFRSLDLGSNYIELSKETPHDKFDFSNFAAAVMSTASKTSQKMVIEVRQKGFIRLTNDTNVIFFQKHNYLILKPTHLDALGKEVEQKGVPINTLLIYAWIGREAELNVKFKLDTISTAFITAAKNLKLGIARNECKFHDTQLNYCKYFKCIRIVNGGLALNEDVKQFCHEMDKKKRLYRVLYYLTPQETKPHFVLLQMDAEETIREEEFYILDHLQKIYWYNGNISLPPTPVSATTPQSVSTPQSASPTNEERNDNTISLQENAAHVLPLEISDVLKLGKDEFNVEHINSIDKFKELALETFV